MTYSKSQGSSNGRRGGGSPYGTMVQARYIFPRWVFIYDKGFVRVAGLKSGGTYEKLISIEATLKTGLLVIVTDKQTYTFHGMSEGSVHSGHALEAAGKAVLAATAATETAYSRTPANLIPESEVAEKLKNLADLFQAGLLTKDEFSAAKARLLG